MKNNVRSRYFQCLLYPDNMEHVKVLSVIESNYEFAYITHDLDLKESDELYDDSDRYKKTHVHCILFFNNATTAGALSKKLGLDMRFIQPVMNIKASLRYLCHIDNTDKAQYDPLSVVTSSSVISSKLNNALSSGKDRRNNCRVVRESETVSQILNYILDHKIQCMPELTQYIISNNYWDVYRRNYYIIKEYVAFLRF